LPSPLAGNSANAKRRWLAQAQASAGGDCPCQESAVHGAGAAASRS
jgi:hypothetical protein